LPAPARGALRLFLFGVLAAAPLLRDRCSLPAAVALAAGFLGAAVLRGEPPQATASRPWRAAESFRARCRRIPQLDPAALCVRLWILIACQWINDL
jgi:hypothetical protein